MGNNFADFRGEKNPNYKTGMRSNGESAGCYGSWVNMRQRCRNKNNPKYERYGGRGISISPEWETIEGFAMWAKSSGWKKGMTLDRIDNDGDYTPENCRWVSNSENSRKKSTTKISYDDAQAIRSRISDGECEHKIAEEFDVVHGTIWFIKNDITHVPAGKCVKRLRERKKQ